MNTRVLCQIAIFNFHIMVSSCWFLSLNKMTLFFSRDSWLHYLTYFVLVYRVCHMFRCVWWSYLITIYSSATPCSKVWWAWELALKYINTLFDVQGSLSKAYVSTCIFTYWSGPDLIIINFITKSMIGTLWIADYLIKFLDDHIREKSNGKFCKTLSLCCRWRGKQNMCEGFYEIDKHRWSIFELSDNGQCQGGRKHGILIRRALAGRDSKFENSKVNTLECIWTSEKNY